MIFEQLGTTAIRPEAPAGDDVKAEPDFEAIELEIGKLTSPAASSAINWQRVAELSGGLLANKGKDLRVACYLALALAQTRKFEGLNIGLKILADLLSGYWNTMYPPPSRIRGRRNAIEWWLEKTVALVRNYPVEPLPIEQLSQLKQRLSQIDAFLKENDAEGPVLEPLISAIRSISAQEVKSAILISATGSSNAATPASTQNPGVTLRESMKSIQQSVRRLLESDVFDARLFRLNRAITWIDVQLPTASSGVTKINPPSVEVREELERLRGGDDPAKSIRFAELKLIDSRLWLDLNRVSSQMLAKLGEKAAPADLAVKIETASLLRRLPDVQSLAFADGSPLADDCTREWIVGLLPAENTSRGNAADHGDEALDPWRKIEALGAAGSLIEAARAVDVLVHDSSSAREQLVSRVRLCEIFVAAKAPLDSRPYFEPLLDAVDRYHLEDWEPGLALRALAVAFRGLAKSPDKETAAKRRAELLRRIATISSSEALRLSDQN